MTLKYLLLFEICARKTCKKFVYKHSETIEYLKNLDVWQGSEYASDCTISDTAIFFNVQSDKGPYIYDIHTEVGGVGVLKFVCLQIPSFLNSRFVAHFWGCRG